jgi:hypothetical protein
MFVCLGVGEGKVSMCVRALNERESERKKEGARDWVYQVRGKQINRRRQRENGRK